MKLIIHLHFVNVPTEIHASRSPHNPTPLNSDSSGCHNGFVIGLDKKERDSACRFIRRRVTISLPKHSHFRSNAGAGLPSVNNWPVRFAFYNPSYVMLRWFSDFRYRVRQPESYTTCGLSRGGGSNECFEWHVHFRKKCHLSSNCSGSKYRFGFSSNQLVAPLNTTASLGE